MDSNHRQRPLGARGSAVALLSLCLGGVGCSTFSGTTATSFLRKVESSRDPNERYKAYESLASTRCYDDEAQKVKAVQVLCGKLERRPGAIEDWYEPSATRAVICRTLGTLKHPAAREVLIKIINDPDPVVRAEACRALGKVGQTEDATVLARVMTADSWVDCRVAAIDALGDLKSSDPRINLYLVQTMGDDEDPAIRFASLGALKAITGKDLGVEEKPWKEFIAANPGKSAPANTAIVDNSKGSAKPATPTPLKPSLTVDNSKASAKSPASSPFRPSFSRSLAAKAVQSVEPAAPPEERQVSIPTPNPFDSGVAPASNPR